MPAQAAAYDRFLDAQVAALVVVQLALCAACAGASLAWRNGRRDSAWYLQLRSYDHDNYSSGGSFFVLHFLTFWGANPASGRGAAECDAGASPPPAGARAVLYSYLVPISLYVSMEIVKYLQGALFISRDAGMRDPASGEFAAARNTNLNEDLGMARERPAARLATRRRRRRLSCR